LNGDKAAEHYGAEPLCCCVRKDVRNERRPDGQNKAEHCADHTCHGAGTNTEYVDRRSNCTTLSAEGVKTIRAEACNNLTH
jgi:hypothetical protein